MRPARFTIIAAALASTAGLCRLSLGQQQVYRIDDPAPGPFGTQMAVLGDKDGDGHDDIVVAVYIPAFPGSTTLIPQIWFYSGLTGLVLGQGRTNIDEIARAGDSNGDGVCDYVVSCPGPSQPVCSGYYCRTVEVRSGVSDSVLWSANVHAYPEMGTMLVGDLDIDGDGRPDVLVGSAYPSFPGMGTGSLFAVSNGGTVLYEVRAAAGEAFARGLGKFVDVDGDGCDEFLLGIYDGMGGAVDIRSGRDGSLLRRLPGHPPVYCGHGSTAAMIGDLDGDGLPDVVSGDSCYGTPGVLQALGSVSGNLIHRWQVNAVNGDRFGYPTIACVDIDRDGVDDVVASAPGGLLATWGQYVFSGRDGTLIKRFAADLQSGIQGTVRVLPPRNGDLFRRYVSRGHQGYDSSIYLISGAPGGVVPTGASGQGTLAQAPRIGVRQFDPSGFRITLAGAEPGVPCFLVLGFSQPTTPVVDLQALGFLGCTLFPNPDIFGLKIAGGSGLAAGYAMHDFVQQLRTVPGVGTYAVYAQWVALGQAWPGGVSEAVRLLVH